MGLADEMTIDNISIFILSMESCWVLTIPTSEWLRPRYQMKKVALII